MEQTPIAPDLVALSEAAGDTVVIPAQLGLPEITLQAPTLNGLLHLMKESVSAVKSDAAEGVAEMLREAGTQPAELVQKIGTEKLQEFGASVMKLQILCVQATTRLPETTTVALCMKVLNTNHPLIREAWNLVGLFGTISDKDESAGDGRFDDERDEAADEALKTVRPTTSPD